MIHQPVHILLRLLFISLVLVLAVALGTEVAALHRKPLPTGPLVAPVVVRKSSAAPAAHKSVHTVRHRAG
ncbi:hypothetical protein MON38_08265 [Hymenobacter sp. DH14]|uniref:Uncharacterized protein n=1 Tax=Hymenobacter cyanobacteriorum TaxID=2926463 RepID=A0A9X1VFZ2_9BACT|nr:hypothetical protein [Hymenobacter cyanobacteriorum]MCI1187412.1 hypothetical protein [Hymenobacter cyanobacteriorum]